MERFIVILLCPTLDIGVVVGTASVNDEGLAVGVLDVTDHEADPVGASVANDGGVRFSQLSVTSRR